VSDPASPEITCLLQAWSDGDARAEEHLWPLVYDELRQMAAHFLRAERRQHTLQSTALVHEAYVRMVDQRSVRWQDRCHFFAIAARMMRRVLVDHARARSAVKRGEEPFLIGIGSNEPAADAPACEVVAIDEALTSLERIDREKASIVELRFFAGLSGDEIAELLGCSRKTVQRNWLAAKAWLYRELERGISDDHR
jgi:RNA polymerase sigma factor (TIGR02999 family)